MLWVNTKRIIRSGFVNFWRNGFVSLASVLIMTVTLFTIGSIVFLGAMLEESLTGLREKVDVNVYFLTEAGESDILALKSSLEALPEVASVEYVSRDAALAQFQEEHKDDQLILSALGELGENPLGAAFNVRAHNPSQYAAIDRFLASDAAAGASGGRIIDRVNYSQNQAAIDKLSGIIESSRRLGLALTAVLVALSLIITFNTIRLAIYTAREEISVMRLVGAGAGYVRGPFMVEGILYGVAAGLLVLVLFYPLTLWVGPFTESFFGATNVFDYYVANFGRVFAIVMGSGVILGVLSSYLAVRRYLRV